MAALDFPDNPSPGDTFDSGSVLWRWTGTTWEIVGAATGATRLRYSAVGISSSVSLPDTTNTTIPYDERLGGEDWRNGNGTLLTVPASGVYLVTSYIELGIGISTLTRVRNTIICAGSASQQFVADSVPGAVSHTAGFSKSVAVPLKAGDTISVIAWQSTGSGNSLTARTNLSAVLLDSDLAIPVSGGGSGLIHYAKFDSSIGTVDMVTAQRIVLDPAGFTFTAEVGKLYRVKSVLRASRPIGANSPLDITGTANLSMFMGQADATTVGFFGSTYTGISHLYETPTHETVVEGDGNTYTIHPCVLASFLAPVTGLRVYVDNSGVNYWTVEVL